VCTSRPGGYANAEQSLPTIVASWIKTLKLAIAGACLTVTAARPALADGVSAYLPLNLEPETERQIERVLILADEPVLKRPFAVALVELALPKACERDKALCTRVKKYLERYSRDYAVTHASATGSITHGADGVVPNEHGLPIFKAIGKYPRKVSFSPATTSSPAPG